MLLSETPVRAVRDIFICAECGERVEIDGGVPVVDVDVEPELLNVVLYFGEHDCEKKES